MHNHRTHQRVVHRKGRIVALARPGSLNLKRSRQLTRRTAGTRIGALDIVTCDAACANATRFDGACRSLDGLDSATVEITATKGRVAALFDGLPGFAWDMTADSEANLYVLVRGVHAYDDHVRLGHKRARVTLKIVQGRVVAGYC